MGSALASQARTLHASATTTSATTVDVTGQSLEELDVRALSPADRGAVTRLIARRNRLRTLPTELATDFPRLQDVTLRENHIEEFPMVLCSTSMQQLAKLSLAQNRIGMVPDMIGALVHLQVLSLAGNRLRALPEAIGELRQLRSLDVQRNQLTELPEAIGQLAGLRELLLQRNQLSALPASFRLLIALETLNVAGNRLAIFPRELMALHSLQEVHLSENGMDHMLEEVFTAWPRLRVLEVHTNNLTVIPRTVRHVGRTLARLNFALNKLTRVPWEIGELIACEWFNINGNQVESLPETVGQMTALKKLGLVKNHIRVLPNELAKLHRLAKMDIRNNQLTVFPPTIQFMPWLTILYADNPLTREFGRQTSSTRREPHSLRELALRAVMNSAQLRSHIVTKGISATSMDEVAVEDGTDDADSDIQDSNVDDDKPPTAITNPHVLALPIPTRLQRMLDRPRICHACLAPYVSEHFNYIDSHVLPGVSMPVPVLYQVCSELCIERLEGRRPFELQDICTRGLLATGEGEAPAKTTPSGNLVAAATQMFQAQQYQLASHSRNVTTGMPSTSTRQLPQMSPAVFASSSPFTVKGFALYSFVVRGQTVDDTDDAVAVERLPTAREENMRAMELDMF